MHEIKLCVDRIEKNIIIAFSRDGSKFCFSNAGYSINESDIILAMINDNGEIVDIKPLPSDTEKIKVPLSERLKKLFKNQGV